MARRWPVVVLASAVLLLGVAVLLLPRASTQGGDPAAATGLGGCSPLSDPAGAAGYEAALAAFADPDFLGADVGLSLRLPDGRLVWMYGDTTRRPHAEERTVRNSMVLDIGRCRHLVRFPQGGAAIPDRDDGIGYWPTAMLARRHEGMTTLHVMAQRMRPATNDLGFVILGPAIAEYDVPDNGAPVLRSVTDLGPDDSARIGWGAALAEGDDGWWYVYGTRHPGSTDAFGWEVHVARTRAGTLGNVSAWEYWDGSAWVDRADRSVAVIPADGGVSQTFSVIRRDGAQGTTWYAVSKRDGDLGTDLAVWAAPAAEGPFGTAVPVGLIPNDARIVRYMPLAHPDLTPATADAIVVSVSRNSLDPQVLAQDPLLYRPFFVDVSLPPLPSGRWLDPRHSD